MIRYQRKLSKHGNSMQHGILDWILEQKDISGKSGKSQVKTGV